ncbi:MAG TPA: SDR family NAD(P)-dependent oxidoreductase [Chthonomonadaceae bacterium]|nr:SDR family NAD(P)-dependent oxidoreductase [Chthonomonadaceae bacterium]
MEASMGRKAIFWAGAGIGVVLAGRALLRKRRAYDLAGKVVLITGGSRGLGLVMAREFASRGARLALCARDAEELDRAREDLETRGAEAFTVPCDVTDRALVERMVEAVRAHYGRIDVLVNNAGIITVGPMETMTVSDFEEAMQVHFWASVYTALAIAPEMQQRREGRIVTIASIGGKISVPHLLPYDASKFAQVGFSEGLRAELAKDGVLVTTVCPGLMRTGSHVQARFKSRHKLEATLFSLLDTSPLTSISAESAARRIVDACVYGDPELVLSFPAQAAATFHALFPGVTADLLGLANRALPGPGGIGSRSASGQESETAITASPLMAPIQKAAAANNEAGA